MKRIHKLFVTVGFALAWFAVAFSVSLQTTASASSKIDKVLFTVKDEATYSRILAYRTENPDLIDSQLYDLRIRDESILSPRNDNRLAA